MDKKTLDLKVGQKLAADGFFEFLFNSDKELNISGPAGVGKTFLMGYLIDDVMPEYFKMCELVGTKPEYDSVQMTATTNKAAEVLSEATSHDCQTIHSFMNLKVQDDYATGASNLIKTKGWKVHERYIIFIDEGSTIDTPLRNLIHEGTSKCKIVYVSDHCQLGPVKERSSPIYLNNIKMYELTEPVRNAGQPALVALCAQLRAQVETLDFKPIQIVPGVVDLYDDEQMETAIQARFMTQDLQTKILAYKNERVLMYNEHIRDMRGLPLWFIQGEKLINNSAMQMTGGMISVEQEIEIVNQNKNSEMDVLEPGIELEIFKCDVRSRGTTYYDMRVPRDRAHYTALVKYYQKKKDWGRYFNLKQKYPDFRQREASTVHKSQGSTYETVMVDLNDLSTCHSPLLAARLLFVAISRARSHVILYGQLTEKYGGVIHQ